ncbi:MAG: DUF3127 domain-containing protein [Bacteroidales bacterium]
MEIEGKILQLLPVQNISSQKGPMKKLEFVVGIEAKFPRKICFSLWNDKVDIFSSKMGDTVKVFFDLESREYNGRWYTEAKAWKVENLGATAGMDSNEAEKTEGVPSSFTAQKEEMDDLPF